MRTEFARWINIGIIVLCGWILWSGLSDRSKAMPALTTPISAGQTIASVGALGVGKAPKTLIVFTSSECHFCIESLPFYRRLAQAVKGSGVRLVAVSWEDPERNKAFLASGGVTVDAAVSLAEAHLALSGTPTLILVRHDGKTINTWPGWLDARGEEDVLYLATRE